MGTSMKDANCISGDYVDLKFIKTRKVLQLVIELPIEAGPSVVAAFGTPLPDQNVPVAVARLQAPAERTKEPQDWGELKRVKQAGILCKDSAFQTWLQEKRGVAFCDETAAATTVRRMCGVNSRRDLDTNPEAGGIWDSLVIDYRNWPGFTT